jgi:hypothetical protein
LLPYVEQQALFTLGSSTVAADKTTEAGTPLSLFSCPSDATNLVNRPSFAKFAFASYTYNSLVFVTKARIPATFADGTSNTVMFAEQLAQCTNPVPPATSLGATFLNYWGAAPGTSAFTPNPATSILVGTNQGACSLNSAGTSNPHTIVSTMHTGTMQVAFGDGSARGVSQAIASSLNSTGNTVWYDYCTPASGEILPSID